MKAASAMSSMWLVATGQLPQCVHMVCHLGCMHSLPHCVHEVLMLAHADWQEEEGKPEAVTRSYSVSSEGHAADKAALQGFAKTRDAASSPAQPSKVLALPCPDPSALRFIHP